MNTLVYENNGEAVTDSKLIANKFGKEHRNVIRAIQNAECSEEFARLNFELGYEKDANGQQRPYYILTEKGFSWIAMGFTGKKAAEFKEQFINQFFEMREWLNKSSQPQSQEEMLVAASQALLDHKKKIDALSSKVQEIESKTQTRPDYYTIAGYGSLIGIKVNIKMASRLGQKAARICKNRDLPMDTTPDPRFGTVKMYPKEVLEEVFKTDLNR